jgi:hypothetical protein
MRTMTTTSATPRSDGSLLALTDVSVGPPTHQPKPGQVWQMGRHVLVIADVLDGWPTWAPLLEPGSLFMPYPGPYVPLSCKAETHRLVLVQPNPWLAGHILDKYAAINDPTTIHRRAS